ncbi:autotransporter outer membrane beta-barrel domain-containing protein, partial [Helicobacter sp. faydin-H17]
QAGQYGYIYSDRILVLSGGNASTSSSADTASKVNYIQVIADANTNFSSISYHGGGTETQGNIAVATVKGTNGNQVATFEGATQIQGFDVITTTLTAVENTDEYGKKSNGEASAVTANTETTTTASDNSYTTYFVDSIRSQGVSKSNQMATTSALGLNYELFLANFNSLNKRMGELRNNDHSQGAWGRIFNGMLSTKYGLETQSIYTTVQAGYDYAFGFEGANNYLGLALSYANSIITPKTHLDIDQVGKGIDKSTSHAVEVAVYNSYIQDAGWFNDTILKFSYIMSDLEMAGQENHYNTNNFGIVFSNEVGYRFKLGETKEWYIDPQVELSFGYFNQSDLKQVLGQATLTGIQEDIFNLRTRIGAAWGYDFKNFT